MNTKQNYKNPDEGGERGTIESWLTYYVDGELPFSAQPKLFAHLAVCEESRRHLDSIMRFRRIIRDENLGVPPAVDDAFFKRLAKHKKATALRNRASDRTSLWRERTPLTFRGTVMVFVMVFLMGLFTPLSGPSPDYASSRWVYGEEEFVEFPDYNGLFGLSSTMYVFYPGLTIEAAKGEESVPSENL